MPDTAAPVFPDFTISDDHRSPKSGGKGHAFRATLFAHVHANDLWESGTLADKTFRPVWMLLGCSEHEAAAVRMNLLLGRPGVAAIRNVYTHQITHERYELMRRAKFVLRKEAHPEGVVLKAYLPDLFKRDPGMIAGGEARFVLLPDRQFCLAEKLPVVAPIAHVRKAGYEWAPEVLRGLLPLAPLFLAYLNRRTRCPLLPDLSFALQVLAGALHHGFATRGKGIHGPWKDGLWGYREVNVEHVGALPGVAFRASKAALEPFLAEEIARYLRLAPPEETRAAKPMPKPTKKTRAKASAKKEENS